MSLQKLENQIHQNLQEFNYPKNNWIPPRKPNPKKHIYNIIIIGGGQSALAAYFGLQQEKINNILILDENPPGLEGPWSTFARMNTLRTPKNISGPENGFTLLAVQTWYKAKYGEENWNKLEFIPTEHWAEYLNWFRKTISAPVQNNTKIGTMSYDSENQIFILPSNKQTFYSERVILANGIDGSGQWTSPKIVTENLPAHSYSHTRDNINFTHFSGKKVAILGAGASAFDNAIKCLEHANEVQLFFRRNKLVTVNPYRWAEFVGFLKHHRHLNDEQKWRFIHKILEIGQLPPKNTYNQAKQYPNFKINPNTTIKKLEYRDNKIYFTTNKTTLTFDHIICATGFKVDLSLRPELKNFLQDIKTWKNTNQDFDLDKYPYLQPGFQFTHINGQKSYLDKLFCYNFGCLLSNGFGGAFISGMKYSISALVDEISKQIYLEHSDYYYDTLCNYNEQEEFL